jgi:hypothetical protein
MRRSTRRLTFPRPMTGATGASRSIEGGATRPTANAIFGAPVDAQRTIVGPPPDGRSLLRFIHRQDDVEAGKQRTSHPAPGLPSSA